MTTAIDWAGYFAHNRTHRAALVRDANEVLTSQECEVITSSIQQFQLGEQSEGKRLLALAQSYADRTGDSAYVPALRLFIQEEQAHASELKRFMETHAIPTVQSDPVDGVFRFVRRLINLEVAIVTLLSAELIAMTYYKALHDATGSPMLRGICRQILRDEVQHLRFQTATLRKIRSERSVLGLILTYLTQQILFTGVLLLVWANHVRVYRAGGFSFRKFWHKSWTYFTKTFSEAQ